jgi:hypothetical protein
MSQASFALRGRNPDVLTCIANLSNDEVFTHPDIANEMLDRLSGAWAESHEGASIWENKEVRFLDPFAKSGVFLREITARLVSGLEHEIPDLQTRVDHILSNQVFGIAITQLTGLLSRRSLYCSKFANGPHSISSSLNSENGNVWFGRIEHEWRGGADRRVLMGADGIPIEEFVDGKCSKCGANRRDYERGSDQETHAYALIHGESPKTQISELFGEDMYFDVVIGNPPYQLGQSGGDAKGSFAMPIYQKFVDAAKSLDPKFVVMVTPSRWFAGGRGLDAFRHSMLSDGHLKELVDFPNATEVFPGTDIAGGVSYFVWAKSHQGQCRVQTRSPGISSESVERDINAYEIFVRYNTGVSILEKVWPNGVDASQSLAAKVSPTQPFGLRTSWRGLKSSSAFRDPVGVLTSEGESFIERSQVPRNADWVDQWKVLLGLAYGERGSFPFWITAPPIVLAPGKACTETYLVIDCFDEEKSAQRLASYLKTKFVRFLISLQKYTQHLYSERFSFVPSLSLDKDWTDHELAGYFNLTPEEVEFIDAMIRPMDGSVE